jgi:hypothetical protein
MLTPTISLEYPVRVLHKGHIAFRSKTTYGREIIYPDGTTQIVGDMTYWVCGTCRADATKLSVIAGDWKTDYEL